MTLEQIELRVAPAPRPASEVAAELLQRLLAAAWRRRYVIATPLLVLPVLGAAIGSVLPRPYEISMSVLVQERVRQTPFFDDFAIRTAKLSDRIDALRALVTSRQALLGIVEELGLVPADASEDRRAGLVQALAAATSLRLIGQEMVEFRLRGRSAMSAEDARRALQRIGERFMAHVREPEDGSLRQALPFLDRELAEARSALAAAETALAEFKDRNSARLPEQRAANAQRLARLRDELREREVRLAGAEGEIGAMSGRLEQTDPAIGRLEQDIADAMGELALLRASYTEEHSRVQAARRRLEMLERQRDSYQRAAQGMPVGNVGRLWNRAAVAEGRGDGSQPFLASRLGALEQARGRLEQLRSETANLRETVEELTANIANSGEVERELRVLERDVAAKEELVRQLRRRQQMAQVADQLNRDQAADRVRVVDPPHEVRRLALPLPFLSALAGLAAGLVLGIGLAVVLDFVEDMARRTRELRRLPKPSGDASWHDPSVPAPTWTTDAPGQADKPSAAAGEAGKIPSLGHGAAA